jgi:hypothetical protein
MCSRYCFFSRKSFNVRHCKNFASHLNSQERLNAASSSIFFLGASKSMSSETFGTLLERYYRFQVVRHCHGAKAPADKHPWLNYLLRSHPYGYPQQETAKDCVYLVSMEDLFPLLLKSIHLSSWCLVVFELQSMFGRALSSLLMGQLSPNELHYMV